MIMVGEVVVGTVTVVSPPFQSHHCMNLLGLLEQKSKNLGKQDESAFTFTIFPLFTK
jgi:hypothetical protein